MNFNVLKEKAFAKGITAIETYTAKNNGISISMFDGEIDGNNTEMSDVICVRGVYNNQLATVYTECSTDDSIDFVVEQLIQNATYLTKNEPFFIYEGDKEYPTIEEEETDYEAAPLSDKIDLLKKITARLRESKYAHKVICYYEEGVSEVAIKNTNGLDVSKTDKSAYVVAQFVAAKDGDVKVEYDYRLIKKLADFDLEEFTTKVIDSVESQFGAAPVASGIYNVVLDKNVVRSLLGAYAGMFSAQSVLKKLSFIGDRVGEKIMGENISIINDPLHKDAQHKNTFDDEGVATKKTTLVENGVLQGFLHNLSTASQMNTSSTGNGFKAGVSSDVGVSPSNLYIPNGTLSQEELFASVGEGVFITNVTGLHAGVNAINGNYSLQSSGFVIRDGKKAEPVTLIIVSSNILDTLSQVTAIGNDLEFRGNVGAPSLAVSGISISGK